MLQVPQHVHFVLEGLFQVFSVIFFVLRGVANETELHTTYLKLHTVYLKLTFAQIV